MSAAAQRWLQHHSALVPSDAVLMGVSSAGQVKPNIEDWLVLCILKFIVYYADAVIAREGRCRRKW